MFYKIISLETFLDYTMLVGFSNGEYRKFDLKPYMEKYPSFKLLENIKLYKKASIDKKGYGIVWNDEIDLSSNGIYENGIPYTK